MAIKYECGDFLQFQVSDKSYTLRIALIDKNRDAVPNV